MSKFILTGATGFVGSNVANMLLEKGHDVFIICRSKSNVKVLSKLLKKENIFRFDNNINNLIDYFKKVKCDCVINMASLVLVNHVTTDIEKLIDSNLTFTTYILEAMKIGGTKNIINTGTSWQHYNNEEYNPVCLYAATKEAFEKLLEYYVKAIGFKCITLKLFDTYGEGDKRKKFLNILKEKSLSGEKLTLTKGEQQLDLTHVDDVASGYLKAFEYLDYIKYGEHKKYAICTGRRLNLKEIVSIFEKETKLKTNADWGALDYRNREVMKPWSNYEVLPNWKSNISFEEGVRRFVKG